jgi:hypothetical protein
VARRLVITNGEWTTRHEIGDVAIVIGRDPNCDLFFVNQKLSRRHARVEPGRDGVKLVDLGSRNGIWVNEQKVDEHLLAPGDAIRLGGLRIVYEEDSLEPTLTPGQMDSTVMLPGAPGPEEETIQRGTDPESETAETGSEATVLLPGTPEDKDRTVMLSDGASPPPDSSATVMLARGGGVASEGPDVASTRVLSASDATQMLESEEPLLVPEPEPLATRLNEWLSNFRRWGGKAIAGARSRATAAPWQAKFIAILSVLGFLLYATTISLVGIDSVGALLLAGMPLVALWAYAAWLLGSKLTVAPVENLRRDVEAVTSGEKQYVSAKREYRELAELAESINRLTGNEPSPESTTPRQEEPELEPEEDFE